MDRLIWFTVEKKWRPIRIGKEWQHPTRLLLRLPATKKQREQENGVDYEISRPSVVPLTDLKTVLQASTVVLGLFHTQATKEMLLFSTKDNLKRKQSSPKHKDSKPFNSHSPFNPLTL